MTHVTWHTRFYDDSLLATTGATPPFNRAHWATLNFTNFQHNVPQHRYRFIQPPTPNHFNRKVDQNGTIPCKHRHKYPRFPTAFEGVSEYAFLGGGHKSFYLHFNSSTVILLYTSDLLLKCTYLRLVTGQRSTFRKFTCLMSILATCYWLFINLYPPSLVHTHIGPFLDVRVYTFFIQLINNCWSNKMTLQDNNLLIE